MTEPLPAGLAPWAWQLAAHLLVPPPATPGTSTSLLTFRTIALFANTQSAVPRHELGPMGREQ